MRVRSGPSLQHSLRFENWQDPRDSPRLHSHIASFQNCGGLLLPFTANLPGYWVAGEFSLFFNLASFCVWRSLSALAFGGQLHRGPNTSEGFSQPPAEYPGFGSGKSGLLARALMHLQTSTVGHWCTSGGLLSTLQVALYSSPCSSCLQKEASLNLREAPFCRRASLSAFLLSSQPATPEWRSIGESELWVQTCSVAGCPWNFNLSHWPICGH